MHLLYLPMNRREKLAGILWLAAAVLSSVLPLRSDAHRELLFHAVQVLAAVLIFHRFLGASLSVPLTTPLTIVKFALLGLILAQLANLLTNDLIFYFLPNYFGYSETGPYFLNAQKELLRSYAAENFPLTLVGIVFFVPVWEELLHRGLVFGSLVQKNIALAYIAAVLLYAVIPIIPLFGAYRVDYILLSFLQYIPISLMFCWIYTRTETILTPMLAHMLMNAVSIFTLR